jgi:hypothetical protein
LIKNAVTYIERQSEQNKLNMSEQLTATEEGITPKAHPAEAISADPPEALRRPNLNYAKLS